MPEPGPKLDCRHLTPSADVYLDDCTGPRRGDNDQRRRAACAPTHELGRRDPQDPRRPGLSQRRLAKLADIDRASLLRFEMRHSHGNLDMVGKSPRCIPWSSAAKSVQSIAQLFQTQPCVEALASRCGLPSGQLRLSQFFAPSRTPATRRRAFAPLHPLSERGRSQV
jgi:hypothetical protein